MPENTPQPGWVYKPGGNAEPPQEEATQNNEVPVPAETPKRQDDVTWTASEYIAHHKSAAWYLFFILGIAACSGLIFLLTKDIISTVVIIFCGILFAILAARKPRQLGYKVDAAGITIDDKFYPYTQFKFFSLVQDGVIGGINFWPLKRFMPELSIYYPPEQADKIIEIISEHLPNEQRDEHIADRMLKKIRF